MDTTGGLTHRRRCHEEPCIHGSCQHTAVATQLQRQPSVYEVLRDRARVLQDRIQALEREALLANGGVAALRDAVTAAERASASHEGALDTSRREAADLQSRLSASQVHLSEVCVCTNG
jgi:chromosome segregation ATPase